MHCWLGREYASPTGWQPTARIGLIMFHSTTQVFIEYTIAVPVTLCYRYIQQPIHGTRSQVDRATQQSAGQHPVGGWTTSRVSNEVSYSHCHSPDPMLLLYYSLMVSADQTTVLREGYWASYNVPFYEQVFQLSGYAEMAKQHGQEYTHDLAVRAEIFRRDQGNVTDMKSYQQLMQSNGWYRCTMLFCLLKYLNLLEYKTDPYADGNPMGAICSRGDLGSPPMSGGCTDSKVLLDLFVHCYKSLPLIDTPHRLLIIIWQKTWRLISEVDRHIRWNVNK